MVCQVEKCSGVLAQAASLLKAGTALFYRAVILS